MKEEADDALEQELATVKRKLEVKEEADDAKAKLTPIVGAGKDGFFLRSPDGKSFQFRLRGYLQADTRWFETGDAAGNDTFAMRRVRPIFEGTLFENIDFRIMPDFAGGSPTLFDAYINLKYLPEAQLQIGKFKPPIGLERLQSATANTFVERGLPTFLVPTRDLGVQVWSDLREGMVSYAIGGFNGARDSGNADVGDIDSNDAQGRGGARVHAALPGDQLGGAARLRHRLRIQLREREPGRAFLPPRLRQRATSSPIAARPRARARCRR